MSINANIYCDICGILLTANEQGIIGHFPDHRLSRRGLTVVIGRASGNGDIRNDLANFTGLACIVCYDRIMKKAAPLISEIRSRREPGGSTRFNITPPPPPTPKVLWVLFLKILSFLHITK